MVALYKYDLTFIKLLIVLANVQYGSEQNLATLLCDVNLSIILYICLLRRMLIVLFLKFENMSVPVILQRRSLCAS